MKEKKFILIGHKKRQGKDTFADMLKQELRDYGGAEILSFADPMRAIMAQIKGMSVEEYKDTYNDDEILRDELKIFGNGKMIEYFGKHVWRDVLLRRADKLEVAHIIVPDFRFLREIIDGALTVKVNRGSHIKDTHQSETELDHFNWDVIIDNRHDLRHLEQASENLAEYLVL